MELSLIVDIMNVNLLLVQKISKHHFLRDIEKSFQEVAPIGPETHHFFRGIEKSFQGVTPMGPEPHQFLKYFNKYGC